MDTYNEPFAGSLAVLLARPHDAKIETVNDLDCYVANFWRALQHDPDAVAAYADAPVNEADLHARHRWLVSLPEFRERMMTEPDYFEAKVAGWWVWGQCLWIGSGWCSRPEWSGRANAGRRERGVQQIAGRWQGGGQAGGSGVHAPTLVKSDGLFDYMHRLANRLRRVRVCCGSWERVLTPSVTTYLGLTGVFLDPPYAPDAIAAGANKKDGQAPSDKLYNHHGADVSADVRAWAIEHGDDPKMRIALCGYDGEHEMPQSWECVPWKAHGGYARTERGVANRERERIWFSPHCLKAELPLFAEVPA